MRTVDYYYIRDLVQARVGHKFDEDESEWFGFLLNDAIRAIYDRSDYWPRFLRVEPRTVSRGYIADEEDSIYIYGSGTSEANGLYQRNGTANGMAKYTLYDSSGAALYDLESNSDNTAWEILNQSDTVLFSIASTSTTPPASGWGVDSGTSPSPALQALGNIERILWQWDGQKWSSNPRLLNNYRDSTGIRSTNGTQEGIVWVAYKARLGDTYGDGTGDTTNLIPYEFSRYAALQVRYDMAESSRQNNPSATYGVSYRQVEDAAESALLGVDREGAARTIKNIHRTYYNYDTSI